MLELTAPSVVKAHKILKPLLQILFALKSTQAAKISFILMQDNVIIKLSMPV